MPKVICYTIAFEAVLSTILRQQTTLLIASLKQSGFTGDLKIIHNGEREIFPQGFHNLEEIGVDLEPGQEAYAVKYKARELLDVSGYDWVLFLDCDCLVMGNIDHWFATDADVCYVPESGRPMQMNWYNAYLTDAEMGELKRTAINSGTFAVRAEHYHALMEAWEAIDTSPPLRKKEA